MLRVILRKLFGVYLLCATTLLSASQNHAQPNQNDKALAVFYAVEGNGEKLFFETVEKNLTTIGFNLADPHHRVNDQYEVKYGSTELDTLSFLPLVPDDLVMELFKQDTRIGGFSPFNMLVYKKKNENVTYLGHLSADAIFDITGTQDPSVQERFQKALEKLDHTTEEFLKKKGVTYKKIVLPYRNKTQNKTINFVYEFNRDDEFDIDDFLEEFQNKFELAFIDRGYLIAGYHNFFETDNGEEILEDTFDAVWSYSLCHLKYSYGVFDGKKGRPDGGLFAPCTMFIMIPKESSKLYVMMPTLANVKNTLNITETKLTAWMDRLDREIPSILKDFGMIAIENTDPLKTNPKPLAKQPVPFDKLPKPQTNKAQKPKPTADKTETKTKSHEKNTAKTQTIQAGEEVIEITIPKPPTPPKPPKVITTYEDQRADTSDAIVDHTSRSIRFSKRIPPNYVPPKLREVEKVGSSSALVGDINYGKVSAYLRGKLPRNEAIDQMLTKGGFQVISKTPLDKKKHLEVVAFTDPYLLEIAKQAGNEFSAVLRILIDRETETIHITNPLYIAKAFIQKGFDEAKIKQILTRLNDTFTNLKNSTDALKYTVLPNYRFMKGMPGYHDMIEVASTNGLLEKLKHGKHIAFVLPLKENTALAGITFSKRTQSFVKKIGTQNSALLPYPVLIRGDKAYILDPKYYIAVMYPDLKMSQFMTIATIPGAIIKECKKALK